jgi:hypothetical protein
LISLLITPVVFTLFGWQSGETQRSPDPLSTLEALRRYAGRLHIFCEAGRISIPAPDQRLVAFIEHCVHEVNPEPGTSFHPKVWVLRYESEQGPTIYRLMVMSRNLTFDRSWDIMLTLEGELTGRTYAYGRNHPLGDFVKTLPSLARLPLPTETLDKLDQLQHEVRRVNFELPPPHQGRSVLAAGDWQRPVLAL